MSYLKEILDVLEYIGETEKNVLSRKLLDIILKSKNSQNLSPALAKRFLIQYRSHNLESPEVFRTLLEISIVLDSEKTADKLKELNFIEAANKIRSD